ncbi:MAG: TPM domain-containing protein [Bacteroidetes bacterium]|nr:TPM domain-containing protein [Bacteroidota bacterium]
MNNIQFYPMKSQDRNSRGNILHFFILFIFLISTGSIYSQDIPDRPEPPRLVNDYAGILSGDQVTILEQKLVAFNDSTSTQVAVVIVKSLNGYDKNDFAQRLGQKWGIGQKGKSNGIVVMVKPKYPNEKGEVSIQTGYGLEGVLPDITCKRIEEDEMIPKFAQGDYYGGISAGVTVIMAITKGEYTADQYTKRSNQANKKPYGMIVPIVIIIIIILWVRMNRGGTHSVGKNLPFWTTLFLLGSMGRGGSGNWGNFQSGGGGFGGGGGGFGGFGGGSFGGGGAGGSW